MEGSARVPETPGLLQKRYALPERICFNVLYQVVLNIALMSSAAAQYTGYDTSFRSESDNLHKSLHYHGGKRSFPLCTKYSVV
ncbi:hypothetical protein Y1Q_0015920 [Alligator mississippiensis]|uniref:Uncharacterized protein n=1 Tax=Alligator mississippiensis TaxID=8496 RepID=A0A151MV28_ALLMI|nr:hypothetical protein Y1Q_0015920 [Alligator mississippiensis]